MKMAQKQAGGQCHSENKLLISEMDFTIIGMGLFALQFLALAF